MVGSSQQFDPKRESNRGDHSAHARTSRFHGHSHYSLVSRMLSALFLNRCAMTHKEPKNFNPHPYSYHQELVLEITSLTNLGAGVAKPDDWVVMVPFTVPGERVRARIYRNHKNFSEADLIEVLEPSPDRVQPVCPLFGRCGGCQYQHLSYPAQLEWKRSHVEETFLRIAGIAVKAATPIHSGNIFGYRSKITPHHQQPRNGVLGPLGFLAQSSRTNIVDVESCAIATPAINEALLVARQQREQDAKRGRIRKGATLLLRDSMEGVTMDHARVISERVGECLFQFKAGDFFQNNPFVLPKMVETVVQRAAASGLPFLIDAYCGSGLFGVSAADSFQEVLGIEVNESSVHWARANAAINRKENCKFLVGQAETVFAEVPFAGKDCVVVIDPPRKGCDTVFLEQLFRFSPARLVYVSCDPATQARDVAACLANGYRIEEVQPVDLFPQTRHIENMAVLVHGSAKP